MPLDDLLFASLREYLSTIIDVELILNNYIGVCEFIRELGIEVFVPIEVAAVSSLADNRGPSPQKTLVARWWKKAERLSSHR